LKYKEHKVLKLSLIMKLENSL